MKLTLMVIEIGFIILIVFRHKKRLTRITAGPLNVLLIAGLVCDRSPSDRGLASL